MGPKGLSFRLEGSVFRIMGSVNLKKGAHVVYGGYGVCLVEDIRSLDLGHCGHLDQYFVLRQEDNCNSTLYVPVENDRLCGRLRRVLTKGEIHQLLLESQEHPLCWTPDRQARAAQFQQILQRGVQEELVGMIRCIYREREALRARGKKLPDADLRALKRAQRLVEGEFSFALGIPQEQVDAYIRSVLGVGE